MPPKVVLEDEVATPTRPNHEPLEKHRYREDGLVEVNSKGPHPIYELIRDAEKKWQDKLDRQSRSLEDAVEEYKRRYRRAPPKGFDVWCVCPRFSLVAFAENAAGGSMSPTTTSDSLTSTIRYMRIWKVSGALSPPNCRRRRKTSRNIPTPLPLAKT